jgi:RNA polymerase sigma-70 factor (ECF subfamily)
MSDQEIIKAIQEGRDAERCFALLLDKYQERIYWHVFRIVNRHEDADDVSQNTFIKVWTALPSFRADSALYTWIFRIATNEALSHLRKDKHNPSKPYGMEDDEDETGLENQLVAEKSPDAEEIQSKLQAAIDSLPEKQKAVFSLRYYEEMKYEDMSEIMGTSVGALKASYHHAVKKIEEFLKAG